ncbi:type II secretion system F family protein [Paraburkholderia edwinii]|jgi:tight adherence protein B|uniref:Type II secretion system F family protein n=1 Tax=Paraburkholderia edwinii TaxID=2861782 RepID=A0ABX8UZX1_9BURK|nr:type II secretion system F family protein [Paraburkholderia edwinii]QYD72398.1 type II secretion system F family protein [Paraburkholderia edwinii]
MSLMVILAMTFAGALASIWLLARAGSTAFARRTQRMARDVEQSLADALLFVNRQRVIGWTLLAMLLLPCVAFVLSGSAIVALVTVPAALMVPRRYLAWMRNRRMATLERQLPDALLMMAGALRAGASFPIALESMVAESSAPISQEFELLMREIRLGIDLDIAMHNVEARIPVPDFLMVTAAVTITREVGGNLAEALESVARTLQQKLQMEGKIKALTSQGRMQGIVMTCLPLFLMVVLRFMEPAAMAPLFSEPIGWGTLAVIAVMEFLGYQSISRITRIDV